MENKEYFQRSNHDDFKDSYANNANLFFYCYHFDISKCPDEVRICCDFKTIFSLKSFIESLYEKNILTNF